MLAILGVLEQMMLSHSHVKKEKIEIKEEKETF